MSAFCVVSIFEKSSFCCVCWAFETPSVKLLACKGWVPNNQDRTDCEEQSSVYILTFIFWMDLLYWCEEHKLHLEYKFYIYSSRATLHMCKCHCGLGGIVLDAFCHCTWRSMCTKDFSWCVYVCVYMSRKIIFQQWLWWSCTSNTKVCERNLLWHSFLWRITFLPACMQFYRAIADRFFTVAI